MTGWKVRCLGQAGVRLSADDAVLYFDPYLSDAVEQVEGLQARRLTPAPMRPSEIRDATCVLVSHDHLDHYDPDTLVPLANASPRAKFIVPTHLCNDLVQRGVDAARVKVAAEDWHLIDGVRIRAVPACHPTIERGGDGKLRCVGYVVEQNGHGVYFAGDTAPHPDIVEAVRREGGVKSAFIPINERNVYKERAGIIGNMSVREAFAFAEELGVQTLVPIHYDMFAANSVLPEEAQLVYDHLRPPFELRFKPEALP